MIIRYKVRGRTASCRVNQVSHFKSDNKYTDMYVKGTIVLLTSSIRTLQKQLGSGFVVPHRGYLVNSAYIDRVENDTLVLTDGTTVPVSKRLKKAMEAHCA